MKKKVKKTLLEESQVRRFLKLASLKPINENFFDTLAEEEDELEDEEEMEPEIGSEMEPEMGSELPAEEEPMGGGKEELVKNLVDAIAGAIEDVAGVEVSVDEAPPAGEELPTEELPGEESPLPPPEEEEEEVLPSPMSEDGRGRSGDDVSPDRRPKGSGRHMDQLGEEQESVEENKDKVEEEQEPVEEGCGKSHDSEEPAKRQYDESMISEIAKRVAARLIAETKKK